MVRIAVVVNGKNAPVNVAGVNSNDKVDGASLEDELPVAVDVDEDRVCIERPIRALQL